MTEDDEHVGYWLKQGLRRQRVLMTLVQPLTVGQIARCVGYALDACGHVLRELRAYALVHCLNPLHHRHRLHAVTEVGRRWQDHYRGEAGLPVMSMDMPQVDWGHYARCLFKHRRAILQVMIKPMQPSEVRRAAIQHNTALRMSDSNCRAVMAWMRQEGLLETATTQRHGYAKYVLTSKGQMIQALIQSTDRLLIAPGIPGIPGIPEKYPPKIDTLISDKEVMP